MLGKTIIRILAVAVLLTLLAVLVPSATPLAIGEEAVEYPAYNPVTLTAQVEPIPFLENTPYAPHKSAYVPFDPSMPFSPQDKKYYPAYVGYHDASLDVRVEYTRAYDTTIQLVWVQIAHPSQMRAALCRPYPSKSAAHAAAIAKRVNAVLAINGDYFTYRKEGYITRNGKAPYRQYFGRHIELFDVLIIDENADLHIIPSYSEEEINDFLTNSGHQIIHSYTFGPGLVIDGVRQTEYPLDSYAAEMDTQRLVLCQMAPLSYLIIATEGPENKGSTGLTMEEISQFCLDMGAQQAYNLDGGSSASVILGNQKINSLSTGKTRSVGDILYFVTGIPEE